MTIMMVIMVIIGMKIAMIMVMIIVIIVRLMLIMIITVMLIMLIMTAIITIIATTTAVITIIIAAGLFICAPSLFPVLHQFFLTDSWRWAPNSDLPLGTDRRAVAGCFWGPAALRTSPSPSPFPTAVFAVPGLTMPAGSRPVPLCRRQSGPPDPVSARRKREVEASLP